MKRFSLGVVALLLSSSALLAQGIRVELHDGTIVEQRGVGQTRVGKLQVKVEQVSASRIRFELWNFSAVPIFSPITFVDTPIYIANVGAGIPQGWVIEWAEFKEAQDVAVDFEGQRIWSLVTAEQRKTVLTRLPLSRTYHLLIGGERQAWYAVDPSVPPTYPDRNSPLATTMKQMLGCDQGPVNATLWPRLARAKQLFKGDPNSLTYVQTAGTRDLGWYMRWYHRRFGYAPEPPDLQHLWPTTTAWDFGMIPWSEGNSNAHYDPIRHCIENYLTYGDPWALVIAKIAADWKCTHGFHDEEEHIPGQWGGFWNHRWAYEKTGLGEADDQGRRGYSHVSNYYIPSFGHEWDMGTLMLAYLLDDPYLKSVMQKRGEKLLLQFADPLNNIWQGYWGIRLAAYPLQNLYAFWKLTGDVRFKDAAQRGLDAWFGPLSWWPADQNWIPDIPGNGVQAPWMSFGWFLACLWWMEEGVGTQYQARLDAQIKWSIDNSGRIIQTAMGPAYQACSSHFPGQVPTNWAPPLAVSFGIPAFARLASIDPAYVDEFNAAKNTVGYGTFIGWSGFVPNIALFRWDWGSDTFVGSMTKAASQHQMGAFAKFFQ